MAICRDRGGGDRLHLGGGVLLRRYIAARNGRESPLNAGLDHTVRSTTGADCRLHGADCNKALCGRNNSDGSIRDGNADNAECGNGAFRVCNDSNGTSCDGSADNGERGHGTACNAAYRNGTGNDGNDRAAHRIARAAVHDLYLLRNRPFTYG